MTAVFRTLLLCLLPLSPLAGQRGSAEGGPAKRRDDLANVPQVTKGNSFLSYDDSRSIGAKATHVRDQDLGGDPIPADGSEGPAPAVGPPRGLNTLPDRPLVFGYLNALRNANGQDQVIADLPAALQAANLEAFDVLITAFAEPLANGGIGTGLGAFSSYLPAVVAEGHALGKSVVVSVGGAYPASLATQFATIAASPTLRQAFSNNIVAFLQQHQLDGVDIDYEFPADAAARANFTLLMQTLHATVKAADPRSGLPHSGTDQGLY